MAKWTKEDDEVLQRMAADGYSATQIGEVIGRPRNAICGRAWRKGFKLLSQPGLNPTPRKPRPKTRPQNCVKGYGGRFTAAFNPPKPIKEKVLKAFEPPKPPANEEPEIGRLSFEELRDGLCKWPVGERYCGCASIDRNKPYCAQHTYVAKGKPTGRQYIEPKRFYR